MFIMGFNAPEAYRLPRLVRKREPRVGRGVPVGLMPLGNFLVSAKASSSGVEVV